MSGINWDIVQQLGMAKSDKFQADHPNFTVAAAYMAGYMECAAERESLRQINARLEKERLNAPVVVPAGALPNLPPLPPGQVVVSTLGSFM